MRPDILIALALLITLPAPNLLGPDGPGPGPSSGFDASGVSHEDGQVLAAWMASNRAIVKRTKKPFEFKELGDLILQDIGFKTKYPDVYARAVKFLEPIEDFDTQRDELDKRFQVMEKAFRGQ